MTDTSNRLFIHEDTVSLLQSPFYQKYTPDSKSTIMPPEALTEFDPSQSLKCCAAALCPVVAEGGTDKHCWRFVQDHL